MNSHPLRPEIPGGTMTVSNEGLDDLVEKLKDQANRMFHEFDDDCLEAEAVRAITELRDRRASPSGVGVKGLEWVFDHVRDNVWYGNAVIPPHYRASGNVWWIVGQESTKFICDSLDGAKAAAEADYRTRILSCLTPPHSITPEGGEVRHEYSAEDLAELYGRDIIERMRIPSEWHDYINMTVQQAIEHDRRSSSSIPTGEAEPVAWRWKHPLWDKHYQYGTNDPRIGTDDTVQCEPLFTSPAPNGVAVSEEMREALIEILDEDAPDKWVWKSHATQDEWLRTKILPLLRDFRAALEGGSQT